MRPAGIRFHMLIIFGAALTFALEHAARAQEVSPPPPASEPPTRRLALHPAAEPRPALQYELLPNLLDRRPGNAAVLYNRIGLMYRGGPEFAEQTGKISEWCDSESFPLDKFPQAEARAMVDRWDYVLDELKLASRREQCDWELPFRERNPITIRLPDLQESRGYARLLRLKARVQIADGDLEGAIESLKTGYALARHVACGETFIHALVGMAISSTLGDQVLELAQQPGTPNLYWALTSLPRPFIDLRPAREEEYSLVYLMYPELRNTRTERHPPEYWNRLLDKVAADVAQWNDDAWKGYSKLTLAARSAQRYPEAKRGLIEAGRSPEEVAAMPVAQVVLLYTLQVYDEARDEVSKWLALPYWEAAPGFDKFQAVALAAREKEIVPLFSVLASSTGALALAAARNERSFALLRTVEALRLYAAGHDGQPPKELADIVAVPVPSDPVTGKSFIYRAEEDKVVLEAPLLPGMEQRAFGARYEIKFFR